MPDIKLSFDIGSQISIFSILLSFANTSTEPTSSDLKFILSPLHVHLFSSCYIFSPFKNHIRIIRIVLSLQYLSQL